jgi:hypothetical protein
MRVIRIPVDPSGAVRNVVECMSRSSVNIETERTVSITGGETSLFPG